MKKRLIAEVFASIVVDHKGLALNYYMTESAHVDLNLQNTESSDNKSGGSSSLAKILQFKSKRLAAQKTWDGLLPTAGRHGKNNETEYSFLKSAVGFGSDWSRLEFGLAELGLRDLRVSKPLIDEIGRGNSRLAISRG